jgi:hypothetical protein
MFYLVYINLAVYSVVHTPAAICPSYPALALFRDELSKLCPVIQPILKLFNIIVMLTNFHIK